MVWNKLMLGKDFSNRVELMKEEIQARLKSEAIQKLVATDSDSANKYVASLGWEEKQTKAKRSKAAKAAAADAASTKEDLARIEEAIGDIMEKN